MASKMLDYRPVIHSSDLPFNGTDLECDGNELRPDGTCAKCERVNGRIATAITAARAEGEAAFRERAIQAAKKLQIGGLNRSVVYNMLNNLEIAAAGSKTKVFSRDEEQRNSG